jgi:hypothetical protein
VIVPFVSMPCVIITRRSRFSFTCCSGSGGGLFRHWLYFCLVVLSGEHEHQRDEEQNAAKKRHPHRSARLVGVEFVSVVLVVMRVGVNLMSSG